MFAANNHFVAPVDGNYLFGVTLLYKINASVTAGRALRYAGGSARGLRHHHPTRCTR